MTDKAAKTSKKYRNRSEAAAKPPKGRKPAAKVKPTGGGRPTIRTDELVDSVLDRIEDGTPLMAICRDDGMPRMRTWYDWCEQDEHLAARFSRARAIGRDMIAQQALDIADDTSQDWKEGPNGPVPDFEVIARSKLRFDGRLRLLACWEAGSYTPKTSVHHTGQVDIAATLEAARLRAINGRGAEGESDD